MALEPSLTALFGTSVGEVGALFVGTSKSASSTGAPRHDSEQSSSRPFRSPLSEEVKDIIPPSSVVVTAVDLQDLVEEGVITEEVGKAVWEGFLRQYAKNKKKNAVWGRQLLRRLGREPNRIEFDQTANQQDANDGNYIEATDEHAHRQKIANAGDSQAGATRKKRSQRGCVAIKHVSAQQGVADSKVFLGASAEEHCSTRGRLSDSSLSTVTPKQHCGPSVSLTKTKLVLDGSASAREEVRTDCSAKQSSFVVIKEFDDLAKFEMIAAMQGLTEVDVQGEMNIIDASGDRFTWETFSPDAEFPIRLEFVAKNVDHQQKHEGSSENQAAGTVGKTRTPERAPTRNAVGNSTALDTLFGASIGEIGTLLGSSLDSSLSTTSPNWKLTPPVPCPEEERVLVAHADPKETQEGEISVAQTGVVVINEFDDLANFETIAAMQGLTEEVTQGDLTIFDASGAKFTWETFNPDAKFPIRLEFVAIEKQQHPSVHDANDMHTTGSAHTESTGQSSSSPVPQAADVRPKPLDALFGTCVGEVGALFGSSVLSHSIPQQNATPSVALQTTEIALEAPAVAPKDKHGGEQVSNTIFGDTPVAPSAGENQQEFPNTVESQAAETRKKRKQRKSLTSKPTSAPSGATVHATALDDLFGNSVGELGKLFSCSLDNLPTAAPNQSSLSVALPAEERLADVPVCVATESQQVEVPAKQMYVVINEFEDLANFETIAASQGLTEVDVQGDMTIIDACGNMFTWNTFSPSAQFPIRLEFATVDIEQKRGSANRYAEKTEVGQVDIDKENPINAAAKRRSVVARAVAAKCVSRKPKRR